MKNILISNPNSYDVFIYVPYVYGLLRWMCDTVPQLKKSLNWIKPIYGNDSTNKLLKQYDIESIDILGLSCYTWNRQLNYRIAEVVKKANPNCFIIAGGPDPDSEDNPHEFLSKYPLIDIIVKREADYSLPLLIQEIVNETYKFDNIPGLFVKGIGDTGPVKYERIIPGSVYSAYSEVFTEIAKEIINQNKKPVQLVESDRGCPYNCAFCYRGRFDNKETTLTPLEYVYQDIEWGGKNGVHYIDIGNSNWGRYKRDIQVSEKLAETKSKYGYPKLVFYSGDKTHANNMAEMIKILNNANMLQQHAIAIQTTNIDALKAAKRVNMPKEDYLYLAKVAAEKNIPAGTQFILGCPGDHYEGVKQSCADVMDMGLVDTFVVLPYQLLPGSWAYTKEYRDEWKLETVIRHNQRQRRKVKFKTDKTSETEYIVGCKTFTREDYIKMWRYYASFLVYVGGNLSRLLSVYLKLNHGISYLDFYSGIVEDFSMNPDYPFVYGITHDLREHQNKFVYGSSPNEAFWEFPYYDGSPSMFEYDECLLISILLKFDIFKKEFSKYILKKYSHINKIESILQFQLDIIITQDYDNSKDITLKHNWIDYFKNVKANRWTGEFDEPKEEDLNLHINQTHCGTNKEWSLNWKDESEYIETVVGTMYQRNGRSSFDINSMVKI